jgi:hypothetical protein
MNAEYWWANVLRDGRLEGREGEMRFLRRQGGLIYTYLVQDLVLWRDLLLLMLNDWVLLSQYWLVTFTV